MRNTPHRAAPTSALQNDGIEGVKEEAKKEVSNDLSAAFSALFSASFPHFFPPVRRRVTLQFINRLKQERGHPSPLPWPVTSGVSHQAEDTGAITSYAH